MSILMCLVLHLEPMYSTSWTDIGCARLPVWYGLSPPYTIQSVQMCSGCRPITDGQCECEAYWTLKTYALKLIICQQFFFSLHINDDWTSVQSLFFFFKNRRALRGWFFIEQLLPTYAISGRFISNRVYFVELFRSVWTILRLIFTTLKDLYD
jgi:hypothetical protein